jgi:hypothetical protein
METLTGGDRIAVLVRSKLTKENKVRKERQRENVECFT